MSVIEINTTLIQHVNHLLILVPTHSLPKLTLVHSYFAVRVRVIRDGYLETARDLIYLLFHSEKNIHDENS